MSTGQAKYGWLFGYTSGCTSYGCPTNDSNTIGYWLNESVYGTSSSNMSTWRMWMINNTGALTTGLVTSPQSTGARPTITVPYGLLN